MANPDHVKILECGMESWNEWRITNPSISPDLSGVEFKEKDLKGVNFNGEIISWSEPGGAAGVSVIRSNLSETSFFGTDLSGAKISVADLSNSNLCNTILKDVDFSNSVLENTKFRSAKLLNTNLKNANLKNSDFTDSDIGHSSFISANCDKTNFSKCRIYLTLFTSIDLSTSIGLDTTLHPNRSSLGIDTISLSKGLIPENFLRGCGLRDIDIEFTRLSNPGLDPEQVTDLNQRIHGLYCGNRGFFHSCFISYSSKDNKFANQLHDDLQNNGVRCWYAPEDLKGGKKIRQQLDEAIGYYDKLLLILSEKSINSDWVANEIIWARKREKIEDKQKLFPVSIVDYEKLKEWELFDADSATDLAAEVRSYFIPDFTNWKDHDSYQNALNRLLKDLQATETIIKNQLSNFILI